MKSDVRERAHELMRAELADAALGLVIERGYDETTADDLARGLGVSRATFFRYLGSKDEAIVRVMLGPEDQYAVAFEDAEAEPGASIWRRLRAIAVPAVRLAEQDPERQRRRMRLIQSLPGVGAKLRRARAPQIDALAGALVAAGHAPPTAQVLATAAVGVLDHCWARWARAEDASLSGILDQAFADLEGTRQR